jgi:hypothetical protein
VEAAVRALHRSEELGEVHHQSVVLRVVSRQAPFGEADEHERRGAQLRASAAGREGGPPIGSLGVLLHPDESAVGCLDRLAGAETAARLVKGHGYARVAHFVVIGGCFVCLGVVEVHVAAVVKLVAYHPVSGGGGRAADLLLAVGAARLRRDHRGAETNSEYPPEHDG